VNYYKITNLCLKLRLNVRKQAILESTQTFNVEKIKLDFPILNQKIYDNKQLVFFYSAASSQKPNAVIDSITKVYSTYYSNVHRGIHYLSEKASEEYENVRTKVKEFINAGDSSEIVFSRNASESLNLVAASWGLANIKENDNIITTMAEHHSNIVPWQQVALRKKANLHFIELTDDYRLNLDQYKEFLELQPKIVVLQHVSNVLGTVHPLKKIAQLAHEVGAIVLVDGAQAAPHMPVNVQDLGADFYAVSAHKMCGPAGIGFLYGKHDLLEKMEPIMFGGDMISEVHRGYAKWNHVPYKFETGTPNIADTIGFGTAIDYLTSIGMNKIAKYEHDLTNYALKAFKRAPDLKVIGPSTDKDRASVFSFTFADLHPHDVAQLLDQEGIAVRSGNHCAQPLIEYLHLPATTRASMYLYNTVDEIDYFVDTLAKVKEFFA
jgi:cysteine desulfurase/selenocysteine lyase